MPFGNGSGWEWRLIAIECKLRGDSIVPGRSARVQRMRMARKCCAASFRYGFFSGVLRAGLRLTGPAVSRAMSRTSSSS